MQCYNNVYVDKVPTNTTSRYAGAAIDATGKDIPDVVINSPTNAHSGADLFIRRSQSNQGSNTNLIFKKPLIVVEGLDVSDATTLLGNGYNYNDFRDEIRSFDKTNFNNGTFNAAFDEQLDDAAGYDLIFVNYHNGVDDILRNALMLQDVINYVNAHKAAGAQQNVVMGISMGGLVSRYCLALMVKSGLNLQTRLLITHDSPHRGANIPLGLQHFLQGIRKEKLKIGTSHVRFDVLIPSLKDVDVLLNAPATAQQLIVRVVDEGGNIATNTFLDGAYRTMVNYDGTGFTQPYRMVATSQGSQCGVPVNQPYASLANFEAEGKIQILGLILWSKANTSLNMHALPNLGETKNILDFKLKIRIKFLLFNIIKTVIDIQKNNPPNLLPLDGLAGGTRALGSTLPSGSLNNVATIGTTNWLLFSYNYSVGTPYIAPSFSFVPTTSSLDIDNFGAVNIPYIVPKTGLNGSSMANYIAQEPTLANGNSGTLLVNTNHTDFYARTCNWLFNEMENLPDNIACTKADDCIQSVISYTNTNCEGIKDFGVLNLDSNTLVTYTVTPANAAILQPLAPYKVRVLALGNVQYVINAQYTYCTTASTISSINYQNTITATQDVDITDISGGTWCGGTSHTFTVNDFGEAATYTWSAGANFTQTFISIDGKTITFSYNGQAALPEPITCNVTSYCYQNTAKTILVDYLGNLVTKQIKQALLVLHLYN